LDQKRIDQLRRGGDENRIDTKSSGTARTEEKRRAGLWRGHEGRQKARAMSRYEAKRGDAVSKGTERTRAGSQGM